MQSTRKLSGLVLALAVALPQMAVAASQGNDRAHDGPKTRAEVQQELREWQRNPVSHDGWMMRGDGMVYVGPSNDLYSSGSAQRTDPGEDGPKTRADVRQELLEWQRNPVTYDGWLMQGDGMVYVGLQDEPAARSADARGAGDTQRVGDGSHDEHAPALSRGAHC